MKGVYEICIFGNHNVSFANGKLVDNGIRRAIAKRQIESMDCFMPIMAQDV